MLYESYSSYLLQKVEEEGFGKKKGRNVDVKSKKSLMEHR